MFLRNKILLGLFNAKPSESRCAVDSELGAPAHRELARRAVRESLVLLKNNDDLLPLFVVEQGEHSLVHNFYGASPMIATATRLYAISQLGGPSTLLAFDLGVYVVVIGLVVTGILKLGSDPS